MVLICSENRKEFGFGHRSRAIALVDCFKSLSIDYIYIVNDKEWKEEIAKQNIHSAFLDCVSGDTNEASVIIEYIRREKLPVSLIFCDGNRFSNTFIEKLNSIGIKTVLIDDLAFPVRDSVDIVWNPNVYATHDLYKDWDVNKLFLGENFLLLRKEFFREPQVIKKSKVFISQGGIVRTTIQKDLEEVLSALNYTIEVANNYSAHQMVNAIDEAQITICGASVTLHEAWIRGAYTLPLNRALDQTLFSQFLIEKNIPFLDVRNESPQVFKENLKLILEQITIESTLLEGYRYKIDKDQNESLKTLQEIYFSPN